jgi:hypothetical protein
LGEKGFGNGEHSSRVDVNAAITRAYLRGLRGETIPTGRIRLIGGQAVHPLVKDARGEVPGGEGLTDYSQGASGQ